MPSRGNCLAYIKAQRHKRVCHVGEMRKQSLMLLEQKVLSGVMGEGAKRQAGPRTGSTGCTASLHSQGILWMILPKKQIPLFPYLKTSVHPLFLIPVVLTMGFPDQQETWQKCKCRFSGLIPHILSGWWHPAACVSASPRLTLTQAEV